MEEMKTYEPGTAVGGRFTVRLMYFSVSELLKLRRKAVLLNIETPSDSMSSFLTWMDVPAHGAALGGDLEVGEAEFERRDDEGDQRAPP